MGKVCDLGEVYFWKELAERNFGEKKRDRRGNLQILLANALMHNLHNQMHYLQLMEQNN